MKDTISTRIHGLCAGGWPDIGIRKPRTTWQYLDVDLSIERGEIDAQSRRLICTVNFTASSQWYEQIKAYQAQREPGGGKIYSYTYPYTYKSVAEGAVEITNGRLSSYPKLTIFGPVEEPFLGTVPIWQAISSGTVNVSIKQEKQAGSGYAPSYHADRRVYRKR